MTFYVTRHGQVAPKENYGDVQFPAGDPPLTKIGSEQAEHLADFMKEIGFCGKIYSSPYARTMETAEIIADRTGSVIVPCAFMREILKTQEAADELCGMTMEELKVRYRHVVDEGLLPYPWWNKHFDTEEDVLARVSRGFTELNPQEDTMFVGHGASAGHLIQFLKIPEKQGRRLYNCSLSSLDTEHAEHCRYLETAHLPYHLVGQNAVMQLDADLEKMKRVMERGISAPEGLGGHCVLRVLHIGDTASYTYPYYEELIRKVAPDVILHTGDLVDEVKVGSVKARTAEYEMGLMELSKILKNSGASEIYVVPGNNDLPEKIQQYMPFAKVIPPDTQMMLGDVPVTLAHAWYEVSKKSKWYFYGHSLKQEDAKPDIENAWQEDCRFNVLWGPKLITMHPNRVFSFERPEDIQI